MRGEDSKPALASSSRVFLFDSLDMCAQFAGCVLQLTDGVCTTAKHLRWTIAFPEGPEESWVFPVFHMAGGRALGRQSEAGRTPKPGTCNSGAAAIRAPPCEPVGNSTKRPASAGHHGKNGKILNSGLSGEKGKKASWSGGSVTGS